MFLRSGSACERSCLVDFLMPHSYMRDETNEVRAGRVKSFHQVAQLIPVSRRYSLETTSTLLLLSASLISLARLARMVGKQDLHYFVASLLQQINDGIVKRVLVLLQPSSQIVRYSTGVMYNSKVTFSLAWLSGFGLDEAI